MCRSKKDVDKFVENLLSKLSEKEFQARSYSVAHEYFKVGDYPSCQKYVELYLKHKDNNAAAFKLYGQALHKTGQKEKALEQFKMSLDFDPSQTTIILDICELLADDEVIVDPSRAKYWCEKAEATFPRHPVTFKLRERLITASNSDPEALVELLLSELSVRPKDVLIHARLLDHYLNSNNIKGAFDHACHVEFEDNSFINNYTWYNSLNILLKNNAYNTMDWLYQLLLLTVRERICLLSITETPSGLAQSLVESNELLHSYDQAIDSVAKTGAASGYAEFHKALLQHHRGQFAFHAATLLLKKAKKDQLSWRDATTFVSPLMLSAWQVAPLDPKVNWMKSAPTKQVFAVKRWYTEGSYRSSQAGHYLLSFIQDKNQSFLDQVSQCYSGTHWRDKFYKKIFPNKAHLDKMKSSYVASDAFCCPILRIPRKGEVEAYDNDAQKEYGNSLHHFVWILLHYKNFSSFKCTLFDMLDYSAATCAPETLNKLDIYSFLYCTTLSAQQQKSKDASYVASDKPHMLPANITDLLCSVSQMKWWDCAYKFSQNELGTELTDIRATLSRGIETIRCIDNHGLDPELLCKLGRIFGEQAELTTNVDVKSHLEARAGLYYQSAIPLLEKLKSKIVEKIFGKRMFSYVHKELGTKELNNLIEECKLYLAVIHFNNCEYEKVIEMISNLKSPQAYYYIAQTYKKMVLEESNLSRDSETKSKLSILLTKAKTFAFKTLNKLKENDANKKDNLYTNSQELIEEIETLSNKIDTDLFIDTHDGDAKYLSDENLSAVSEYLPNRTTQVFRNVSSTPKATKTNTTNYRTAMDTQILDNTRMDQAQLATIENEIKKIQKRDSNISDFMEQTKSWFEENRKLSNEIISTIQTNMQNTTDQFKLLKISVDQVKGEIDECRSEYKDVGELKKDIAELRKEVNKLKNIAAEQQNIDDSELYNLDDEYRTNDNASATYASRLPFSSAQVLPPFNQRLVPPFGVQPNTYQLYNQSLMNLYNQYSQFAQPPGVPGAHPIFDPTRSQVNYSGVFPTPEQLYLDGAHLVPPNVPTVPPIPAVPPVVAPSLPSVPAMPSSMPTHAKAKETARPLPVNVVITSSDPLPTCTTTPAPALSVTIPPKHIKGTPHNYQIPMPSTSDVNITSPPVFTFPQNKTSTPSGGTFSIWNQSSIFKTTTNSNSTMPPLQGHALAERKMSTDKLDTSRTVVDGIINVSSPNTSLNKSRTISEKSNTSVENYDPCPDFKPIVPLPAEVKVTTGEEDEITIFSSRAKLFRFVDKQWKERGIGEIKLLKHKGNGKVRVLMRREQVHKICANHIITSDMEIKPMKNETKAYFWVANDFADEKVVLEKFCIRFKTANIALDFYNSFENARQSSMAKKTDDLTKPISYKIENPTFNFEPSIATSQGKSVIGGFTFSSTPTLKPISDNTEAEVKKPQEVVTNKVNVFSGLSFKSNTSSATSNIFNINPTLSTSTPSKVTENLAFNTPSPSNLNNSDIVEEFEPDVDFKPVIPLPALVDQKTGEEDETILFEHRAKLLRFESLTKEWKERGLGNIKLLVHKDNVQKVRLLMRREQIMKVCCNHAITKDMTFQKMPNMDKAVTWCAKDFSEGELVAETFCLRFKTVLLCDQFIEAIQSAQTKIKDESKLAKEEQNAGKQSNETGFGDKFKPKSGSWHCDTCYTNNLESFEKCACCETPKPGSAHILKNTDGAVTSTSSNITVTVGWGDKFKPKPGSWECKACFVRNEGSFESCSACNSPKDPTKVKANEAKKQDNAVKFNFGIPPTTGTSTVPVKTESVIVSTGQDLFKPNPVSNNKSIFGPAATGKVQFQFGMPFTTSGHESKKEASIFDGTGAPKFNFGVPLTKFGATDSNSAVPEKPSNIFFAQKVDLDTVLDFTVKKTTEQIAKPALLPTPKTDSTTSFAINEDSKFNYVFKPKTDTTPVKSVLKDGDYDDDENDENEYADEDECQHTFTPVIPLPEKIEVVTGEENETVLYGHVAKLYRFTSREWKERGKGIVTILKHKETGKLRVVMRREQILKICLNHSLSAAVTYKPKDDKSWMFTVNDFSDGELTLEYFCLRFKNKEIALQFKEAVDKALEGLTVETPKTDEKPIKLTKDEVDDVIFVNEIQSTKEEKEKASELMLPENFFNYKNKEPCQGCRGCHDDDYTKTKTSETPSLTQTAESCLASETKPLKVKAAFTLTTNASTPVKGTTPIFQSPTNSIYGTPTTADKTVDTSIFRTPLGSIGSNSKTPNVPSTTQSIFGNNVTNKENTLLQKPIIFSGVIEENIDTDSSQSASSVFSSSNTSVGTTSVVIAPPKFNLFKENQKDPVFNHFSFGSSQSKPALSEKPAFALGPIGVSSNKSIFDNNVDGQNTEVKSIFGDDGKSENLFMNVNQGSIFGPGALTNNQTNFGSSLFGSAGSLFGSLSSTEKLFDTSKSLFSSAVAESKFSAESKTEKSEGDTGSIFKSAGAGGLGLFGSQTTTEKPFDTAKSLFSSAVAESKFSADSKTEKSEGNTGNSNASSDVKSKEENPEEANNLFSVTNVPTFAALSSNTGAGFEQTKKNPDFKWQGAGEQLFVAKKTTTRDGDKSHNESGGGDEDVTGADEDYDPQYEPIVPLPDKIIVTTGEEDEEKLFGERCKLYRYDEKCREWKERGIGEMKILYHPERKTYRLLLRREQVHKAVLNMLLHMDLELLQMKNSDRAWTWAGRNFAENPAGEQETLAVRFKSVELALSFQKEVSACVRKLQAIAANAVREQKEAKEVTPLRLPKHLQESARADNVMSNEVKEQTLLTTAPPAETTVSDNTEPSTLTEVYNEDSYTEVECEVQEDQDYEDEEDYNAYYQEEEEECIYHSCEGEAVIRQQDKENTCSLAHIQVVFDQDICSPKILITDSSTGEILIDMVIYTDTEFEMTGDTCMWSGKDYTDSVPVDKTISINFFDSESAQLFYESVKTSKTAAYSSTDPES